MAKLVDTVCGWFSLWFRSWRRDGGRAIPVRQGSQDNLSSKIWTEMRPLHTVRLYRFFIFECSTYYITVQQAVNWKTSLLQREDGKNGVAFFIFLWHVSGFQVFRGTPLLSCDGKIQFKPVCRSLEKDQPCRHPNCLRQKLVLTLQVWNLSF